MLKDTIRLYTQGINFSQILEFFKMFYKNLYKTYFTRENILIHY